MGVELQNYVYEGYFSNRYRNKVEGDLGLFRDTNDPKTGERNTCTVRFELVGNFPAAWAGRSFKFEMPEEFDDRLLAIPENLRTEQVGSFGTLSYSLRPVDRATNQVSSEAGAELLPVLTVEWFSQNGCMVLELVNPKMNFVDKGPSIEAEIAEDCATSVPAGQASTNRLVSQLPTAAEIESKIKSASRHHELRSTLSALDAPIDALIDDMDQRAGKLSQVASPLSSGVPEKGKQGNVPELLGKFAQWDKIFDESEEVPIRDLIAAPLRLPKPEDLQSDEEAWEALRVVLSAFALYGIAFKVCEHFTASQLYQLIISEGLDQIQVHPELSETNWVSYFDTFDLCKKCLAEIGYGDDDEEEDEEDFE